MQTSSELLGVGVVPLDEALDRWVSELEFHKALTRLPAEQISVNDALHRVTHSPVTAKLSSPHYYAAAIDGLAVRAADTLTASGRQPLRIALGTQNGQFVETGAPMPDGLDAVVPFHELELDGDEIEITRACNPWRNVRPIGEDIAAREVVLPRDHRITPLDLGALVAAGAATVQVYRKPRVGVLPVGNRLIEAGVEPGVGEMIDSNSPILLGLAQEAGADPHLYSVVPERLEEAGQALVAAARQSDLVLVVAGPSHGTAFLARLFSDLGDCFLHGVAIKPGHSIALGVIEGTPVMGLPFHPAPAFLAFRLVAQALLARMTGQETVGVCWHPERATLAIEGQSPHGLEEFLRVKLGQVDGRNIAVPDSGGAPTLMSLVRADGLVFIPADAESLEVGSSVDVLRLHPERSLEGNLLLLGTHDICYDLLRNHLHGRYHDVRLHTAATGGAAGLRCLKERFCHIAAIHLFDEETGEYNVPHLRRVMDGHPVVLVRLFTRHLGLAVATGNPLGIGSLADLNREGLRFINRQVGSGTRALLDYHLKQAGVEPDAILGFEQEVRTHMAVAAAVKGGIADVGPTISTAARALRVDFVPCIPERLDLAIPKRFVNHYPVRALLKVIRSAAFRQEAAQALTDYDFSDTGQVVWESE